MLVLGIETTCDETGCAIVRDGKEILSNVIASQEDLHHQSGGVIPEIACRRHVDVLPSVLKQSLSQAGLSLDEIDLIAVANSPGLIGALLIGLNFAKGLCLATGKPLVGVNHVEAHIYSSLMQENVPLPALGVVVSGGHTALILVKDIHDYEIIGQTQDDAIGEAFDKVARLLELPYPGGPFIERLALEGNPHRYPFKAGQIKNRPFDFSFSGLKTAVFYQVKGQDCRKNSPSLIEACEKKDIAASFQWAAFSDIVKKVTSALKEYRCQSVLFGGGVSQNCFFRALVQEKLTCPIFWPPIGLCMDNAAMIGGLGYHNFCRKGGSSLDLEANPTFSLIERLCKKVVLT